MSLQDAGSNSLVTDFLGFSGLVHYPLSAVELSLCREQGEVTVAFRNAKVVGSPLITAYSGEVEPSFRPT